MVDASIGTDETVARFDDQNALGTNDASRLAKYHLNKARLVRKFLGQGYGWSRRGDLRQTHYPTFRFRNDLLSDDNYVLVLERDSGATGGERNQSSEIVPLLNFWESGNHEEPKRR